MKWVSVLLLLPVHPHTSEIFSGNMRVKQVAAAKSDFGGNDNGRDDL